MPLSVVVALALPDKRATLIGCDQRAGGFMVPIKWAYKGKWAIGLSGIYRILPLINAAPPAPQNRPLDVGTWLRELLVEDGFETRERDGGPKSFDLAVLLACPGRLWFLDASLTPFEVRPGELMAVGTGSEFARGAGHALDWATPEYRVRAAIQAAIDFDYENCGGEPVVEWLSE